jgi:16S rRNA (guanine527-N7)-methyltransferase
VVLPDPLTARIPGRRPVPDVVPDARPRRRTPPPRSARRCRARAVRGAARRRGRRARLLGPRETPRLWERHLLNCAGLASCSSRAASWPTRVRRRPAGRRARRAAPGRHRRARRAAAATRHLPRGGRGRARAADTVVRRARAEELAGALGWTSSSRARGRTAGPARRLVAAAAACGGRLLALKGERPTASWPSSRAALQQAGAVEASVVGVGDASLQTRGAGRRGDPRTRPAAASRRGRR